MLLKVLDWMLSAGAVPHVEIDFDFCALDAQSSVFAKV